MLAGGLTNFTLWSMDNSSPLNVPEPSLWRSPWTPMEPLQDTNLSMAMARTEAALFNTSLTSQALKVSPTRDRPLIKARPPTRARPQPTSLRTIIILDNTLLQQTE